MPVNAIVLKPGETLTVVAGSTAYPDHTLPQPVPPVDPGYGIPVGGAPHPSHPIYYPGPPVDPGYGVDVGTGPVRPAHPIYIPAPPTEPPSPPLVIWGGPYFPPEPTHPIVLPPEVVPPPVEGQSPIEWKIVWTPNNGWIVVGVPTGPHPTPSKK